MRKPWSISTTVRNPERIKQFLSVLKTLENKKWDEENQKKFQILLIQNRLYGNNNTQFLNGLSLLHVELLKDFTKKIEYGVAEKIFYAKDYEDPAMRGRQSINPLKKLGFVSIIDGKIIFNDIANRMIKDEADIGDVFFRCFLKWQIPNLLSNDYKYEDGYDIIPFIATLRLFSLLHELDNNFKGLSRDEFDYFIPTLINYKDIENTAKQIMDLRKFGKSQKLDASTKKRSYVNYLKMLPGNDEISVTPKYINNLHDYGDNIIRYFRLTRFFLLRGRGYYIDLEPRRTIEIEELLKISKGNSIKFKSLSDYQNYLEDERKPILPWLQKELLCKIANELIVEAKKLCVENLILLPEEIKLIEQNAVFTENIIAELRKIKNNIQDKIKYLESQNIDNLKLYIEELENIDQNNNKALELEKLISYCLFSLNDALSIKPNYPVGDDNQPIFFAPANKPDIECYYRKFNAICEVTMLKSRDQWYNEGQPVMRHFREFELKSDKQSFCIFIAPVLHRDTLNTFWISVKYEYEGASQKIIPLTIDDFLNILKTFIKIKELNITFTHENLMELFNSIMVLSKTEKDVLAWRKSIQKSINDWIESFNGKDNGN
ncbi:MAG TPA: AlwI family type II restriction endonuclease [Melioribacteraceae bacterium]|nr:AlwI family type II restriction endonuclease [Melioribacteraceae bacterium]